MIFLYSLVVSFLITSVLIPVLIRIAPRLNLIDIPDERKRHHRPVPKVGGIALVVGSTIPVLFLDHGDNTILFIICCSAIIAFFGFLDDILNLSPKVKFAVQIFVACLVALVGGIKISSLGYLWDSQKFVLGTFSVPVTIFWLVLGTNAINLADGLDGLAAGLCLLIFCFICFLAIESRSYNIALLAFSICGAIIGFLKYNTFPAIVFLGDAGSQFLGFLASLLLIILTQHSMYSPVLPLLLLGVPIIDTIYVFCNRILQGKSPFQADRSHLHYLLMDLGFTHQQSVLFIYMLQSLMLTVAFLCRFGQDGLLFFGYLIFSFAFVYSVVKLQKKKTALPPLNKIAQIVLFSPPKNEFVRTKVAYYAFVSMIVLLGSFYVSIPFLLREIPPDLGVLSGFLFLIMLFLWRFEILSKFFFLTSIFFLSVFYFYFLDFNSEILLYPRLSSYCNLLFLALGLLYILYVIASNRAVSVTNLDFLVLIIAIILPKLAKRLTWQKNLDLFFLKLIAVYFFVTTIHRPKSFFFLYVCIVLSLFTIFVKSIFL